ncbi:MAG TPA: hypothetical protein PLD39_01895 [Flexilinea sp.]|nr:hypothetical protein [Flexilinea sp.]HQN61931.1 hypothetical protein [Flexilinea sp.]
MRSGLLLSPRHSRRTEMKKNSLSAPKRIGWSTFSANDSREYRAGCGKID